MYDLLFRHATIVDGSGKLPFVADLAVQDDRIAAIGNLGDASAKKTVPAEGLVLCPGFIDVHSHADLVLFREEVGDLFEPLIRQGITTFVGGNCGVGLAPLPESPHSDFIDAFHEAFLAENIRPRIRWRTMGELMSFLDAKGVPNNVALLAPHGILRIAAMGSDTRHARRDEVEQMCRWLEQALDEGALGLSTGLQYFPGNQSETGELLDLARVLARYDARFTSHLRSYSATLRQAVNEVATIGREAEVHVQISHLFWIPDFNPLLNKLFRGAAKVASAAYQRVKFPVPTDSVASEILENIGKMRESGEARIALDAMPTSAGFTHLLAFFPPWVLQVKNRQEILTRLTDKKLRKKILRDIVKGATKAWPHDQNSTWSMNLFKIMGWAAVSVMSIPREKNKHLEGKNLVEIGKIWKMHPFDAACELLIQEEGRVLVFETLTYPGDDFIETSLYAPMTDPNTSIVTDSILMNFGRPSHLFYDCFPKFLQRYVRETGAVTLEEGIRKCTGLPAECLGLKGRGLLKTGYAADVVLFDPATVCTYATADDPRHHPGGINLVAINGKVVVEGHRYERNALAGRVLRR